jgi:hypothetical protein
MEVGNEHALQILPLFHVVYEWDATSFVVEHVFWKCLAITSFGTSLKNSFAWLLKGVMAFEVITGKIDFDIKCLDLSSQPFVTNFSSLIVTNPSLTSLQRRSKMQHWHCNMLSELATRTTSGRGMRTKFSRYKVDSRRAFSYVFYWLNW